MAKFMKQYFANANTYYIKSNFKGGFLLIEILIYTTLLILLLSMAHIALSKTINESWQFDRVSRLFYYTIKRTQLISFNGSAGSLVEPVNTIYVSESNYNANIYAALWGNQVVVLPEHMKLVNNSRTQQTVYLGGYDGQKDVYSYEIYNYKLRKYRKYIFSQQTPRIRWIEGEF